MCSDVLNSFYEKYFKKTMSYISKFGHIVIFHYFCIVPISLSKLSRTANSSRWIKRWTMKYLAN